jgi:hypothetical protein
MKIQYQKAILQFVVGKKRNKPIIQTSKQQTLYTASKGKTRLGFKSEHAALVRNVLLVRENEHNWLQLFPPRSLPRGV